MERYRPRTLSYKAGVKTLVATLLHEEWLGVEFDFASRVQYGTVRYGTYRTGNQRGFFCFRSDCFG